MLYLTVSRSCRKPCLVILGLIALGCDMPHDVDGTHATATQGKIRVGVSECEPWTGENDGEYSGIEVELVAKLAKQLGAEPEWHLGSESELFEKLHQGQLDIVIGGITEDTPWSDYVGLTRAYAETTDQPADDPKKHVWAVRAGENRWLLELDRFLQEHRSEVARWVLEARQ